MEKYKLITIELEHLFTNKGFNYYFNIKATQEYLPSPNIGHYKYVITGTDRKEDILKVSSSCGAAPDGKINKQFLKNELKRFWAEYKHYQRYLKEDVNG